MTPKQTAVQIVLVKAFPAMSLTTSDRFSDWHHDSRTGKSRGHMPCRAAISRASNTRFSRRQCKREFGNTHGVAPTHHGARPALLDMSTTRSANSSASKHWSDRFWSTIESRASCSLSLMIWRAHVTSGMCLDKET